MTLRCADLPLVDLVDGRLSPADGRAAERHLEGCAACRAIVADLRTVRAAAFTLDRYEPPADLLARIQARLAAEPVDVGGSVLKWPNTRAAWATWLAAAATLMAATAIGLLPLWGPPPADSLVTAGTPSDPSALVESVQADLRTAESHYTSAIQGLEQIARSDGGALDPQVAGVLQKNLQVVDQAINESRAALNAQPTNEPAQEGLFEALRTKVALLQQTVELINEMRKGNQAEAGRLLQDLSR